MCVWGGGAWPIGEEASPPPTQLDETLNVVLLAESSVGGHSLVAAIVARLDHR